MGQAGRQRVVSTFDVRSMGRALDELYRRIGVRATSR
jgi:hypothetical protein